VLPEEVGVGGSSGSAMDCAAAGWLVVWWIARVGRGVDRGDGRGPDRAILRGGRRWWLEGGWMTLGGQQVFLDGLLGTDRLAAAVATADM
jgi:hypothetical protein